VTNLDIYQRTDDRWAWRLKADNGQVIATDGGQGYENRGDCARIANAIARGAYAPPADLDTTLAPGAVILHCTECDSTIIGRPCETIEHIDGTDAHVYHPRLT
jgi:uncharacterized protein YegP (UPF0339 family)